MSDIDDQRKDMPSSNSPQLLERMREAMQTYLGNRGDKLDRGVTVRDLSDAGIVSVDSNYLKGFAKTPVTGVGKGLVTAVAAAVDEKDLTPPPTPSGFSATAGVASIVVQHDPPFYKQGGGHAKTVLYGATRAGAAPAPVFSAAVPLTEFSGNVGDYATNPATVWHLWVKWQTVDGVQSALPAGGINGVVVTTGQDVTTLVQAMTGVGKPFTVLATTTIIDGVTFPAGTYSTQAFIRDAQITTAKIADLAVDSAKIASLTASKLTSGSITVGTTVGSANYLAGVSGWSINGAGQAEFSNAVVRGGIFASTGFIGGIKINAGNIQSNNYSPGVQGMSINSDGTVDLPTGSVTARQIAVGAVSAEKITVGFGGRNMVANSGPTPGSTASYLKGYTAGGTFSAVNAETDFWRPTGGASVFIRGTGVYPAGSLFDIRNDNYGGRYPVVASKRFELSVYLSTHRCNSYVAVVFYDSTGAYIIEFGGSNIVPNGAFGPLANWPRSTLFCTAPANAATAILFVRSFPTAEPDPYCFASSWYFGEAGPSQTEFSPYSPAGQTIIDGSMIRTGSVIASVKMSAPVFYGGGYNETYNWPAAGQTGFHLSSSGLLLGNYESQGGVQIDGNGQTIAIGNPSSNLLWQGGVLSLSGFVLNPISAFMYPAGDLVVSVSYGRMYYGLRWVIVSGGRPPYQYTWIVTEKNTINSYAVSNPMLDNPDSDTVSVIGDGGGGTKTSVLGCIVTDANGRMAFVRCLIKATHADYPPGPPPPSPSPPVDRY